MYQNYLLYTSHNKTVACTPRNAKIQCNKMRRNKMKRPGTAINCVILRFECCEKSVPVICLRFFLLFIQFIALVKAAHKTKWKDNCGQWTMMMMIIMRVKWKKKRRWLFIPQQTVYKIKYWPRMASVCMHCWSYYGQFSARDLCWNVHGSTLKRYHTNIIMMIIVMRASSGTIAPCNFVSTVNERAMSIL